MRADVAKSFLLDQVPQKHQALLPPVLLAARKAVRAWVASESFLQVPSAEDNRARFVSYALDCGVERLIKSGGWPVDCRWRHFERPTGRYLEIRLSHSIITISQVSDPAVQPRDVRFRQNARLHNQLSFMLPEFDDTRAVAGLPAFLLVHGADTPDHDDRLFLHLGVPHPEHRRDYIYRTRNIMHLPHEVSSDVAPVEDTDIEAVLTLKEDIERWRRDSGLD